MLGDPQSRDVKTSRPVSPRGQIIWFWPRSRSICPQPRLDLIASGFGLIEIGLVASKIYSLQCT